MEIYLNQANDSIRFPIVPPNIAPQASSDIETKNIIKLGEIAIFGGSKLDKIDLNTFFPNQEYDFCSYKGFPKPYDFVRKIKSWKKNGNILRLIITDTDINIECMITDFNPEEKDGTGDVYFDLSLMEYRRIEVPKYDISNKDNSNGNNSNSNNNNNNTTNRPANPPTSSQKVYIVKKGDCLWSIARKYYGKGSLYPKIRENNKKTYPSLAKSTLIYPNWKLVL